MLFEYVVYSYLTRFLGKSKAYEYLNAPENYNEGGDDFGFDVPDVLKGAAYEKVGAGGNEQQDLNLWQGYDRLVRITIFLVVIERARNELSRETEDREKVYGVRKGKDLNLLPSREVAVANSFFISL